MSKSADFSKEFEAENYEMQVLDYLCLPDEALDGREDFVTLLKEDTKKAGIPFKYL